MAHTLASAIALMLSSTLNVNILLLILLLLLLLLLLCYCPQPTTRIFHKRTALTSAHTRQDFSTAHAITPLSAHPNTSAFIRRDVAFEQFFAG